MVEVHFGAPTPVIWKWIRENDLAPALSRRDRSILDRPEADLTKQERIDLYWYLEALWALVWAGQLIPDLPIEKPVGDNLASLVPSIKQNEDGQEFRATFTLRPFPELFQMLDLYFRAHWYARDGQLNGYATGVFNLDIIMERRKALEWIADRTLEDWDEAPDST
jgi:hypothetical protein